MIPRPILVVVPRPLLPDFVDADEAEEADAAAAAAFLAAFCRSFSSFWAAYFSLCLSRHRTHLVANPLSPKAAQGRKFLHPLHHLISRPDDATTQTFTSHSVHKPLFWVGMTAYGLLVTLAPPPADEEEAFLPLEETPKGSPFFPAAAAAAAAALAPPPLFFFPPWLHGQAVPHITQHLIPSGKLRLAFWLMCTGKFTSEVNSGTCAAFVFSTSPWNLEGMGGLRGTHLRLDGDECLMEG